MNDPTEKPESVADRNVGRLIAGAYRPESPGPVLLERVTAAMHAAARQRASRPGDAPRRGRSLRRLALWGAAAVLLVGLGVALGNRLGRRAGDDAEFAERLPDLSARGTGEFGSPSPPGLPAGRAAHGRGLAGSGEIMPWPAAKPRTALRLEVGNSLATGPGQRRRAVLPDGSVLYLNQGTAVTLLSDRHVTLARGELFVEVAPRHPHEPGEPVAPDARFVVRTPDREIVALGTRFDVRHGEHGTGVVVTQGKVQVSGMKLPLEAGQQLDPRGAQAPAGSPPVVPAPRATHVIDWTRDLMAAAHQPLVPASQYAGGALVARDPNGQESRLTLRRYHVDVHVEDGFARTTIDQTYFNDDTSRLEGTFYFPLPPDASLSRLAMYVDGRLMEGGMAERGHARQVFEDIVRKMRDPALLEWIDGSTFKMRVFPLEGRQEKRIILSYTQRLPSLYGRSEYRFPAGHSMQQVDHWSAQIRVCGGAGLHWQSDSHPFAATREGGDLLLKAAAERVRPDRDVVLTLGDREDRGDLSRVRFSSAVHEGARYLMLRWRPELPSQKRLQRRDWVFLFESSADRDPLLARVQVEVIKALLENAERDDTFAVLTAGTRARVLSPERQPVTPENVRAAVEFLEHTHLVGALDLGRALEAAGVLARGAENPVLVHVGSGLPVLGEKEIKALAARVPEGVRYVGVGVGKRWSRALMRTAAGRSGGFFTQINPDEQVAWRALDLLATLNTPRLSDVRVVDRDAKAAFLLHSDWVAQGEELCAVTRLADGQPLPGEVEVTGTLDGRPFGRSIPVADVAPKADYLPRTWAKLEIDRLVADGAAKHHDEIVPLSKAIYVMSPFTSLLVLENEEMYKKYGVDRGRKDHWALYPCPATIPVVHEPLPGWDGGARPGDAKGPKKLTAEEVLQTILMRTRPRLLLWDGRPQGPPVSMVYRLGSPGPYTIWRHRLDAIEAYPYGTGVWDIDDDGDGIADHVWLRLLVCPSDNIPGSAPGYVVNTGLVPFERPTPVPGALAEEFKRQRNLMAQVVSADVQDTINQAISKMPANPEGAIQDLKLQLENVKRAPELAPYVRNVLTDQLQVALRAADRRQVEWEQIRQRINENLAAARERQAVNESLWRDEARLQQYMQRFSSLMDERRYDGATLGTRVYPVSDLVLPIRTPWDDPVWVHYHMERAGDPNGRFAAKGLGYGPAETDFDSLIDLITSTIKPTSWEDVGGPGSILPFKTNLSLVVSQTQDVHDELRDGISNRLLIDEPPIFYPDAETWARLTARRRERYDSMDLAWGGALSAYDARLSLSETLAFHDRRVDDLYEWPWDAAGFDQRLAPNGSLFIELYNPWQSTDLARRGSAERRIRAALRSPTSLDFIETPLADVVDYLKDLHGIEIQIDRRALDDVGIGTDTPITKHLKGISLRSALRLMLRELDLTYVVLDEVLLITTPEQAECYLSTPSYDAGRPRTPWLMQNPFERPSRYWDLRLNRDRTAFTNLLSYAPGLNTAWADLCAVVEAEAEPDAATAPGRVDPRARELIEGARKATWQTATLRDSQKKPVFTLEFDGTGRYCYRRTTRHGLGEEVVCDGRHLWHLYPELGLGARRDVTRFHRAALSSVVPWVLPPTADLARGADLVTVDEHTVAVVPHSGQLKSSPLPSAGEGQGVRADGAGEKSGPRKQPQAALTPNPSPEVGRGEVLAPHVRTLLVFAPDGRLAERRRVWMPLGTTLLRETYGTDGSVKLLGSGDKPVAERKVDLKPCALPDLQPDVRKLVVLPMPLRTREHVIESRGLKPDGRVEDWSEDDALTLVAADAARGASEAIRIIGRRFFAKGDRRVGFYTLLLDCLGTWETKTELDEDGGVHVRFDPRADHPKSPLAQYVGWWADKDHDGLKQAVGPIDGPGDGFLQQLAQGHDLIVEIAALKAAVHDAGKAAENPLGAKAEDPLGAKYVPEPAPRRTEPAAWESSYRRELEFVRKCRSPELAWGVVCAMRSRAQNQNASLHAMVAEAAAQLEDVAPLEYAARYTRGAALRDANRAACCDVFEQLIRKAAGAGLRPPVDQTVWQAFQSAPGGYERWRKLMGEVSATLIKRGRRSAALGLAWDLRQLGQHDLAEAAFQAATGGTTGPEKVAMSLAAVRYLWQADERERADATLRGLLEDKQTGKWPALWRLAAWVAGRRDDPGRALRCEERAMELLYGKPSADVPLERIRRDHQALLADYGRLGQALVAAGAKPPEEFLGRIVAAADRWRRLDPEPTPACQAAGKLLADLGAADLAWDYLTTPLAAKPREAAPLCDLGSLLRQQGLFELADRAYASASQSEPANAQILWDRAQVLLQSGRRAEAEQLLHRVAEGKWPAQFDGVKAKAAERLREK